MCICVHRDKCSFTVQIRQKYIKEEEKKIKTPKLFEFFSTAFYI